jgi:hypothetical protein
MASSRGLGLLLGLALATVAGGAAVALAAPRARFALRGDDDGDGDGEPLVSVRSINRRKLAARAQKVYDEWDADSDPEHGDPEVGFGGICQDIADALVDELYAQGAQASPMSCSVGEQHVFVVGQFTEGVYEIDIAPSTYERGSAYTWTKIPDVTFEPGDISFEQLSPDPNDFDQYTEDG